MLKAKIKENEFKHNATQSKDLKISIANMPNTDREPARKMHIQSPQRREEGINADTRKIRKTNELRERQFQVQILMQWNLLK